MSSSSRQSIAELTTEIKPTQGDTPPPLVGSSTTVIDHSLYVFGGRKTDSRIKSNDLYKLDLCSLTWTLLACDGAPSPRYFHSCDVYQHSLIVFGGRGTSGDGSGHHQGNGDCTLDDIYQFDTRTHVWRQLNVPPSECSPQPRYAHLTVCINDRLVVIGGQGADDQYIHEVNVLDFKTYSWSHSHPLERQYGSYSAIAFSLRNVADLPRLNSNASITSGTRGRSLSTSSNTSAMSSDSSPIWNSLDELPISVYSNRNFDKVRRELQTFDPTRKALEMRDHSDDMSGTSQPPGLRFPSGELLGHHLLVTGIYRSQKGTAYEIWAIHLTNLVWTRIDTGMILSMGSWNRGFLYGKKQQYMVLGNRDRDLAQDYEHRQINFDHVAVTDLETFGIYTFPRATCAPVAQELGLSMLNEPSMADVEIMTTDEGKSIPANSAILARRWPYFEGLLKGRNETYSRLYFHENYAVTLAFVQFIYLDHLMTKQQHDPPILSRLLTLANTYKMERLADLATHALHQILTISTASMVYETAALNGRTTLQIRALRVMMYAKKMLEQQMPKDIPVPPLPSSRPLRSPNQAYSPFSPVPEHGANMIPNPGSPSYGSSSHLQSSAPGSIISATSPTIEFNDV